VSDAMKLALAAALALLAALWLGLTLIGVKADLRSMKTRATHAENARDLCLAEKAQIKAELDDQSAKVRQIGEESARVKAGLEADLAAVRAGKAAAEVKLAKLRKPLTASTRCERYDEVDGRLLESLG